MRRSLTPIGLGLGLSATLAFNPGGHHDTLTAAFSTDQSPAESPLALLRRLEAFCTQLPDLAMELDAITQREHVATSFKDWGWGGFSTCGTKTSRHMVAAQFYLHALTSKSSEVVRDAARAVLKQLDNDLQAPVTQGDKLRLTCARGFAEHLLGDTFSHVDLHGDGGLYPTGLGHYKDQDQPDRMLRRPEMWRAWLAAIEDSVDSSADAGALWKLSQGIDASANLGFGEDALVAQLQAFAQPATFWRPYSPPLDEWNDPPERSRVPLLGSVVNLYRERILTTPCQAQIEHGPANRPGGSGISRLLPARLSCHDVWAEYLRRAKTAFDDAGVFPHCPVKPEDDTLEDGQ